MMISHSRTGLATLAVVIGVVAASCGGDDASTSEAAPSDTPTATTAAVTTVPPPTVPATTEPTTTTAPPTTAVPETTESCGAFCPLDEEQQAAVDAFFDAYNGDDWDAVLATLATDEPSWQMTPSLSQNTELMRYDFIWSAGMNEVWEPERCVNQYGIVSCRVSMEDDLHRLLAPYAMEPSRCELSFEVTNGLLLPRRYDALTGCHAMYDGAMHFYGGWFEQTYPELPAIQGVHYRAWNQTDETAGERAAAYLDEWAVVVEEFFSDGRTVHDVTGH